MAQMRSRREQVDAHKFITSRMNQALVLANPDSVERPMRRIGVSIFASVMIMVLVFGGFAIAALLGKGNDAPAFNHIIYEKDTNAIYVYTSETGEQDGSEKLWPVTNYTSALLLLNAYDGEPPTQNLKPESLVGYERGFTVGIDRIPPSPPATEALLQDQNWNACSLPITPGGMSSRLLSELVVEDLEGGDALGDEEFMLVSVQDTEKQFVLWNDRKYAVADETVLNSLGIQSRIAIDVKENILHAIPDGPDLAADPPEYFGVESEATLEDGTLLKYGDIVESGGTSYVLMDEGGEEFAPIGEISKVLLELQTDASTYTGVAQSLVSDYGVQAVYEQDEFPQSLGEPRPLNGDQPALCSVFDPSIPFEEEFDDHNPKIVTFNRAPETLRTAAGSVSLDEEGNIIGTFRQEAKTVLPSGTGAIVAAKPLEGSTLEGVRYLVDSTGIKFGIVDKIETGRTQRLLGYGDITPVGVPEPMLNMIGQGPNLDPTDARSQLDPDGDTPVYETGEQEEAEGGE